VAIKEIKLRGGNSRKHLLMIAREVYILHKLSQEKNNEYTVKVREMFTNPEADTDPN
jgi:hypothetical protein